MAALREVTAAAMAWRAVWPCQTGEAGWLVKLAKLAAGGSAAEQVARAAEALAEVHQTAGD